MVSGGASAVFWSCQEPKALFRWGSMSTRSCRQMGELNSQQNLPLGVIVVRPACLVPLIVAQQVLWWLDKGVYCTRVLSSPDSLDCRIPVSISRFAGGVRSDPTFSGQYDELRAISGADRAYVHIKSISLWEADVVAGKLTLETVWGLSCYPCDGRALCDRVRSHFALDMPIW